MEAKSTTVQGKDKTITITEQCRVQAVSGDIFIVDEKGLRQPLQPGQTLTPGMVVVIESGAVSLENPDHSLTTLMSSDQVEVNSAETPEQPADMVTGAEADDRLDSDGRDADQREQPETDQQQEVLSSSLHLPFTMHLDGLEVTPGFGAGTTVSAAGQAGTLAILSSQLLALQSEPGQTGALPGAANQFYSESFSFPAGSLSGSLFAQAGTAGGSVNQPTGQTDPVPGTFGTATPAGSAGGSTGQPAGQTVPGPGTSGGPTLLTVALTGSPQAAAPQVIPPQPATITGTDSGAVTEDQAIRTQGALTVTDPNAGQDHFVAQTVNNPNGTFTVDASGHWSFNLNNNAAAVQALAAGEKQSNTFTVHSADGTAHQVAVTVTGTNDAPVLQGQSQSVTEDGSQLVGQMVATDIDHGDHLSFSSTGPPVAGFTLNKDGSYTFDPTDQAYQHLAAGQTDKVTIPVTVTDAAGAVSTQNLEITVTGAADSAVITGTPVGTVTEDTQVTASGKLDVTDPDSGQAEFVPQTGKAGTFGSFTVQPDGTWNYQLDNSNPKVQALTSTDQLTDTISVSTKDGTTQQITVTVNGTDDKAIISGTETGTATEDQHLIGGDLIVNGKLNVVDPDSGEATFPLQHGSGSNGYGTFLISSTGGWVYKADNSQAAIQQLGAGSAPLTDSFVIHSADGTQHTLTVTIQGTNDAPVAQAQAQSITEDGSLLSGQMVATDVDTGDIQEFTTSNPPPGFTLGKDGSYTFDPTDQAYQHLAAGQTDKVVIPVTVTDSQGASSTQNLEITVIGTNDAPVVSALTDQVDEDVTGHTLDLLQGATDKEGDALTISGVQYQVDGQPVSGMPPGVSLAADGHTLQIDTSGQAYQHLSQGQTQEIKVSYLVDDGHSGTTPQTASIQVVGQDDKATLVSSQIDIGETDAIQSSYRIFHGQLALDDVDSTTTFEFGTTYLGNGYEPGNLRVYADGRYEFQLETHHLSNAPAMVIDALKSGEHMDIPYSIKLSDGQVKNIIVRVHGEDDTASIKVGTYSSFNINEDESGNVTADGKIYTTGFATVTDPDHDEAGVIAQDVTTAKGGHFRIAEGGQWSYAYDKAAAQHLAQGESFTERFTVTSIDGSASHEIAVTVHGTNDAPLVSSAVSLAAGTEDTAVTLHAADLLANATDVDTTDTLSVANLKADHGAIVDNKDGTFTFSPEPNYNGQVSLTYEVTDGITPVAASATMTLGAVGDAAVISGTDTGDVTEDRHLTGTDLTTRGTLTIADPDAGEEHFTSQTNVQGSGGYGTFSIDANGQWTYTADNSQAAIQGLGKSSPPLTDTLTITSADGTQHTVAVTIHGTNDRPQLLPTTAAATEDGQTIFGTLPGTDADTGDTLTYRIASARYGFHLNTDGSWTFDPSHSEYQHLAAGEPMPVQIGVRVIDSSGVSTQSTVTITLTGTNDAPVVNGAVTLPGGTEDKAQVIQPSQLLGQVTDVDTSDTLELAGTPTADHGTFSKNTDGSFTFLPEPNYNGPVAVSYEVTDGTSPVAVSATMTLGAVGDPAVITGTDTGDVTEDQHLTGPDLTAGGTLTITDPDAGEAAFTPITGQAGAGTYGTFTIDAQGHWTYDADNSQTAIQSLGVTSAPLIDTLTVTSADGTTHDIQVTIHGTNDAPVMQAQTQSVTEDGALLSGQMVATDVDSGDTLTYAPPAQQVDGFTLNSDGSYTFDPSDQAYQHLAAGQTEKVTIPVTVTDAQGAASAQNLVITVTGTNDAPVVSVGTDLGATDQGQSVTISQAELLAHVTDVDGDKVSISSVSVDPSAGSVAINADGSFTYTPASGFSGDNVPVTFTATDGTDTTTGTAVVDVIPAVTHAPVIDTSKPSINTQLQGNNLVGHLQAKDQDHGDTQKWSVHGQGGSQGTSTHGQFGTFSIDEQTGAFTYSPDGAGGTIQKSGTMPPVGQVADSFVVSVTDSSGLSQEVQVDVMVDTNAHHTHGQSGHWVAQIHPVGASLSSMVSADEPLDESVDSDAMIVALDEQAADLTDQIHDLKSQGQDTSEAQAQLDELMAQRQALEQTQHQDQQADHGGAAAGGDETGAGEQVDPGLAGLVSEETPLDFDAVGDTGAGADAGGTEAAGQAQAAPGAADQDGAAAAAADTLDGDPGAGQSDPAADDQGEADKDSVLSAGDVLDPDGGDDIDALLAGQPGKKPVPVEAPTEDGGAAPGGADTGEQEPADVPDSAALETGTVDGGDDQNV